MKTLTEFSTLTLRKAAAARAAAGGAHKSESAAAATAAPPVGEPAFGDGGEAPPPAPEHDAPTVEGGPIAAAEGAESAEAAEGAEPEPMQAEHAAAPTPAEDDPVVKAVSEAVGVQPDRAQRLIEALDIIGDRIDQVRLVRVFQGEKGPHGAVSRGEFHYVIDRVAGSQRRRDDRRDDRRGGDRGGRGGGDRGRGGGGGGGGGFGGDRGPPKPRGLGSLKFSDAKPEAKGDGDDRPGRGELPRAGIGWQLTAAPRDFSGGGGRGPGRGPGRGRGPGGPGGDRPRRDDRGRGPGGPGGPGGDRPRRDDRGPRSFGGGGPGGPGGGGGPRGPRPDLRPQQLGAPGEGVSQQAQAPREPRLGPDGQPLPPRSKRPRKPIGPDANGNGPDGKPWDPERRAQRQAERAAQGPAPTTGMPSSPMNEAVTAPVDTGTGNSGQTPTE